MKDFIFVTGNQHKADYLALWLGRKIEHRKIDLEELQSLDLREVVEHKAHQAYQHVQQPVLVEDVALTINAFGRLPGTLIKWFLQEVGGEGIIKMLNSFDGRAATASIMYGLYDGRTMYTCSGHVSGHIADAPRSSGDSGWHSSLSWNSIFIPDGSDKTYAEMTDDELESVSHRAQAIAKLRTYLNENA